jgi:hypothetical protein
MPAKQIKAFMLSSSLSTDICRIDFQFMDGSGVSVTNLPPARYNALVATLQASTPAYYCFDPNTKTYFVSSAPDAPGLV